MAPGLIVNFGSGAAGSTPSLQVRGVTTYGTDNSPLVIIDGVPGDMSFLEPRRHQVNVCIERRCHRRYLRSTRRRRRYPD